MTLELKVINCNSTDWSSDVVYNYAAIESFINSLDSRQTAATAAVASEVGTARGGKPNLGARLDSLASDVVDAVALSESVAFGDQATIFDPTDSYIYPKLIVYNGDTYRCLSKDSVVGVLPTDSTIWKMLTNANKAETPNLILKNSSANMGVRAKGRVVLDYDANLVWNHTLPDFSVVKITDVDDDDYVAGKDLWEFSFKAPIVTVNTVFTIKLAVWFGGIDLSDAGVAEFTSIFVPVQDGATMAYANSAEVFPGATIENDTVLAPASSIGAVNEKQIVSGKMEIATASGELDLISASKTEIKTSVKVNVGDKIITDAGESVAETVTEAGADPSTAVDILGDGSCRSFFPFEGTPNDLGPNAAHIDATGTYVAGKYGQAAIFPQNVDNASIPFMSTSFAISWYTSFTTELFLDMFKTSLGSIGLNWIQNENNWYLYGLGGITGYKTTYGDLSWMIDDGIFHLITMSYSTTTFSFWVDKTLIMSIPCTQTPTQGYLTQTHYSKDNPLDNLRVFNRPLVQADVDTIYDGVVEYSVAVDLPDIPTKAYKEPAVAMSLGAGAIGEYVGPKIEQTMGEGSTDSTIFLVSADPVAAKIFVENGLHNKILCSVDGAEVLAEVTSVSETGTTPNIITTVNLITPLSTVPTKVAIPDRYTLTPTGYTFELSEGKLKVTADKIELLENTNLKQLAMAVRGPDGMPFENARIYIQEKAS